MNPFLIGIVIGTWATFAFFLLYGAFKDDPDYTFGSLIIFVFACIITFYAGNAGMWWEEIYNSEKPAAIEQAK